MPLDGRCGQVPRPSALSLTCSRSSSLPFLLSVKFLGGRMKSSAEVGRPGNTATRIWSSGTPVTCRDHRVKPWTSQPPRVRDTKQNTLGYKAHVCAALHNLWGTGPSIYPDFLSVSPWKCYDSSHPLLWLLHTFSLQLKYYSDFQNIVCWEHWLNSSHIFHYFCMERTRASGKNMNVPAANKEYEVTSKRGEMQI